jgi:hypothetical protein
VPALGGLLRRGIVLRLCRRGEDENQAHRRVHGTPAFDRAIAKSESPLDRLRIEPHDYKYRRCGRVVNEILQNFVRREAHMCDKREHAGN